MPSKAHLGARVGKADGAFAVEGSGVGSGVGGTLGAPLVGTSVAVGAAEGRPGENGRRRHIQFPTGCPL